MTAFVDPPRIPERTYSPLIGRPGEVDAMMAAWRGVLTPA